jgi:hypothetical protein
MTKIIIRDRSGFKDIGYVLIEGKVVKATTKGLKYMIGWVDESVHEYGRTNGWTLTTEDGRHDSEK